MTFSRGFQDVFLTFRKFHKLELNSLNTSGFARCLKFTKCLVNTYASTGDCYHLDSSILALLSLFLKFSCCSFLKAFNIWRKKKCVHKFFVLVSDCLVILFFF